ncbi:hypothetical protein NKH18_33170 [Streptomyces sp. M10(2022)]
MRCVMAPRTTWPWRCAVPPSPPRSGSWPGRSRTVRARPALRWRAAWPGTRPARTVTTRTAAASPASLVTDAGRHSEAVQSAYAEGVKGYLTGFAAEFLREAEEEEGHGLDRARPATGPSACSAKRSAR